MSTPYTVPGNCQISALSTFCHFRKINPNQPFNYGPETVERNSQGAFSWLTDMKRRLDDFKTGAKYAESAKYARTREVYRRIGKKSENLKFYGRL